MKRSHEVSGSFEEDLLNSQSGPPEKTTGRRERHRVVEQKRRERTKELLVSLQQKLAPDGGGGSGKQSLSMNEILEKAVESLTGAKNGSNDAAISRAIAAAKNNKTRPPSHLKDVPDMLSIHALDPTASYVYVNDNFCDALGYDRWDLIGQPAYQFFKPEDMKFINDNHIRVLKTGRSRFTYRIQRKDTEYAWIETASRLTDRGIVCITRIVSAPNDNKPCFIQI
mmetsp:Transcript_67008/g.165265  ORF Transcript_67008/g.165265 Transcript_67008/m.165265 type:complete len:225 (+) Transcript_67008:381-1055(+)